MSATISVVPNSWFTKVKAHGTFRIDGVPSGAWHVAAWAPERNISVERDLEVAAGKGARFDATLGD